MLKWLKKKLKNWILEDDYPPSLELEVRKDGKIERVITIGVAGFHLHCQFKNGSQMMIKEDDAMN